MYRIRKEDDIKYNRTQCYSFSAWAGVVVRVTNDARSDVMYGNVGTGGFETISARGIVDSLHSTVIVHV